MMRVSDSASSKAERRSGLLKNLRQAESRAGPRVPSQGPWHNGSVG